MITFFKVENNKSKKKYKENKMLTTKLKSIDTIVIKAPSSNYIKFFVTGIGIFAKPKSTATACGILIGNKVLCEIVLQKHIVYEKQGQKDQQATNFFDKLYRKSLQNNVNVKTEYDSFCNIFKTKIESFFKYEHKNEDNFF